MKNLLLCTLLISNMAFCQKGTTLIECFKEKKSMGFHLIEPDMFLQSNDSFYSYCYCFAYMRQHGIWNYEADSTITLRTSFNHKDSFIKTLNLIEEKTGTDGTELWFEDQNLNPLQLQVITRDTSISTDSLGRIILHDNSFLNVRCKIKPSGYSKAYFAYLDIDDTCANKFTIVLSKPSASQEYVYSLQKRENTDCYNVIDKAGNKLVAIYQKCPEEGKMDFMLGK